MVNLHLVHKSESHDQISNRYNVDPVIDVLWKFMKIKTYRIGHASRDVSHRLLCLREESRLHVETERKKVLRNLVDTKQLIYILQ